MLEFKVTGIGKKFCSPINKFFLIFHANRNTMQKPPLGICVVKKNRIMEDIRGSFIFKFRWFVS